ncbi:hypothetical protein H257_10385 [Aphanomyces astaci]|uniref:Uncharacterized protein n=1 Tax=Aphanomyces astaci TaxID=112090 RepID=W4G8A5_APHAT|nr:hypothetical protein H257_10385 [Aphanomyces astaci]ETV75168.1 hypothetical protein H257_10385 [Aphanomyces astaci]|eukprot:XP_009835216.1 hypothetical protein H257_10385 [Aphanomyces astaci]
MGTTPHSVAGTAGRCVLLSGPFETCVQVALGMIAMSVLVVKRHGEKPRRPLGVWLFDASKQAIGAGVAHAANIAIAIALVGFTDKGATDECAMYFVNFALDTSLGVVFNWVLLTLLTSTAKQCNWTSLQSPGDYGDPVRVRVWLMQLTSWLAIILTAKLIIGCGIVYCQAVLVDFAVWVFAPLEAHPRVELVVVMIACPCLMNALQFWVQDSFLKKKAKYDLLPRTDTKGLV